METQPNPTPSVALVVQQVSRNRIDCRSWKVTVCLEGRKERICIHVTSPNRDIGKVEAVANVLRDLDVDSVCIPSTGLLRRFLLLTVDDRTESTWGPRARHVGLADALGVLKRWRWRAAGSWLLGALVFPPEK